VGYIHYYLEGLGFFYRWFLFLLLFRSLLGFLCVTPKARGTITANEVVVQARSFRELYISTPSRRIPLDEFQKIMVEINPFSVQAERILLIGKFGNPDILLARKNRGDGRILGKDLSCLLGIPYDERLVPY
jgi:hypothetical protein